MAKVTSNLIRFQTMADEKVEAGLRSAALHGEAVLKADYLSRPGEGRLYEYEFRMINGVPVEIKSLPRPPHRASAAGDPPAPDTGGLRAATQADTQIRRDGDALVGRIVANKEYAAHLELGTERMAPRPYMSRLREKTNDLRRAFAVGARAAGSGPPKEPS